MRRTFVAGVGMTAFGKFVDMGLHDLGRDASVSALRDAGIRPKDVEMIACGCARSGAYHADLALHHGPETGQDPLDGASTELLR